jgi:SAM-dependent methyltransferase
MESEMPDFECLSAMDVSNIALQRTETLRKWPYVGVVSYKAWKRGFNLPLIVESSVRRKSILGGAWSLAVQEFQKIEKFIPEDGAHICDIGCGHGFIDLVAAKKFNCKVTLIDIEDTDERHHSYSENGAGYANLEKAKRFLTSNGIPSNHVQICNPKFQDLPAGPFDLIISLLSAGFHYPVEQYLEFVRETLKPNGVFVFDLRVGTDQPDLLEGFSEVTELSRRARSARLALRK